MSTIIQTEGKNKRSNLIKHVQMRNIIIAAILILVTTAFFAQKAWTTDTDTIIIDLDSAQLNVFFNPKPMHSNVTFGGRFFPGVFPVSGWEVEQLTSTQYRLRHKSWGNYFWSVDYEQKKVWRMKEPDLRVSANKAQLLDNVTVMTSKDMPTGPIPMKIFQTLQKNPPSAVNTLTFSLKMTSLQLLIDQRASTVRVLFGGAIVSNDDAWEVRRVSADALHFRFRRNESSFWQVNLNTMNLSEVWGGNFGFSGGRLTQLSENLHMQDPNSPESKNEIPIDLEMARYREKPPKSAWQESEKALNETVLKKNTFDVLIVPFQVGGHAIDRVDRALMTRYLSQALEATTSLKMPSPTLVMRALGESARTFNDYDVFQLANKLGVKQIIRGYVGHNLNERMSVTIFVQTRNEQEYFSQTTKAVKYEWRDIAISDERTPAEAFASILHDVTARLQPSKVSKKTVKPIKDVDIPTMPSDIRGLAADTSVSPVVRAYYLQLLGILHPEQSVTKEQLFARSLVVLREMAPQSSAYKVLKARALFYLYRRPAATVVLSDPKSAEERALSAVLDGDLQLLEQSIKDIKDPLPKLIAQIELSDLLWSYNPDQAPTISLNPITKQYPNWEMVLTRRLQHRDGWIQQSNIEIKRELDKLFPVKDFTVESIIKSKVAIGELPIEDDDIIFSVYNHYRRLMDIPSEFLTENESTSVVKRDVLDLLVSLGESNLLKKIRLRRIQSLNEEIVSLIDRYEAIYQGHPEMVHQKAIALSRIAYTKQGQAQENLRQEASLLHRNACYWSQGQTTSAPTSCITNQFYATDYPRRWYWTFSSDPRALSDRKYRGPQEFTQSGNLIITPHDRKEITNYELSLLYTQTDFSKLSAYYEKLQKMQMDKDAADLLKKNSRRFIGNPGRTYFFARLAEKEGDRKRAQTLFEDAIVLQTNNWGLYHGLSSLMIRSGDFKAASETALKYPLFQASKPKVENQAIDNVALSNHAFSVGSELWWSGAPAEAKPLFTLSAGYETGSGSGMLSDAYLAILNNNFQKAAQTILVCAKRYNQPKNYNRYAELLHIMGFHNEAWSVFTQIQSRTNNDLAWSPVLIGLRMEGKTADEQLQWLKKQPANVQASSDATMFTFLVHTLDRNPDSKLSAILQGRQESIELSKKQLQPTASRTALPDSIKREIEKHGEPTMPFSDGYVLIKRYRFNDAYAKLKVRFLNDWIQKNMFSFAIPYLAWSAAKSGTFSEFEPYLAQYRKELGADFDYYLSKACLSAGKNEHQEAIQYLKSARNHVEYSNGTRLFPVWYQLMETCEWLYEDSKFDGYRELLVEYARIHQVIRPMDSWAYAFEAKHTKSATDRIRALALTLYLDKQSDRIKHFSTGEKNEALKWLKANNPFLQHQTEARRRDA